LIIFVPSCQLVSPVNTDTRFPESYEVAVIRTSDYKEGSYIELYDKELNLVGTVAYPDYTCLENMPYSSPYRKGDEVFIAHRGYIAGRKGGQVVSFNAITGESTTFDVNKSFVSNVVATKDYIYAVGGNFDATVAVLDNYGAIVAESMIKESSFDTLTVVGDTVYAGLNPVMALDEEPGAIASINTDASVDVKSYTGEMGPIYSMSDERDGKVYFGTIMQFVDKKQNVFTNRYAIGCYSTADETVHKVVDTDNTIGDIITIDNCIYALQTDVDSPEKSYIYTIDIINETITNKLPLGFLPSQMINSGDSIYVYGFYKETGDYCLRQYRIDNEGLILKKETELNPEINRLASYFVSGIFVRNQT
jgi:hypothetical protein